MLIELSDINDRIKRVNGFDDYYISDAGDVYSERFRGREKTHRLRKLKPKNPGNSLKYYNVVLCRDGEQKTVQIHRLVAEHFVEGYFDGAVVNHIDGDNRNNRSSNLEWVSHKENIHKSYLTSGVDQTRNWLRWSLFDKNGVKIGEFKGNKEMCQYIRSSALPISCSSIVKYHHHNGYYVITEKHSRSCNDYPQGVPQQ